jgi:hypothetical protein
LQPRERHPTKLRRSFLVSHAEEKVDSSDITDPQAPELG